MKRKFKILLTISAVLALCLAFVFTAMTDGDEVYVLDDVTRDMLTNSGGVPTLVINTDKNVKLIGSSYELDFALKITAPHTSYRLAYPDYSVEEPKIPTILGLDVTGDLSVSGGVLTVRGNGDTLKISNGTAQFSTCTVTVKSLDSVGAVLHAADLQFDFGGLLIVSGADTGLLARQGSSVVVGNDGALRAYSVHSSAVRIIEDSRFDITSGKVTLGGGTRAISGTANIADGAYVSADPYTETSAFIATKDAKIAILIDPGHGGKDPGSVFAAEKHANGSEKFNFYLEKNLAMMTSNAMKQRLEESSDRFTVYMTRTDDTYLSLVERCMAAGEYNPDIFISVHFNYDAGGYYTGCSAYVPQFDRYVLPGLADSILDNLSALGMNKIGALVKIDTEYDGDPAAYWDVYDNVKSKDEDDNDVPTDTYSDYYGVVNGTERSFLYPILVEHLHLSSPSDMKLIADADGVKALGYADAEAILEYFHCGTLSDAELSGYCRNVYKNAADEVTSYAAQDFAQSVESYFVAITNGAGTADAARNSFLK